MQVSAVPSHTKQAVMGERLIALSVLNLGAREWVVNATPQPALPRRKTPGTSRAGGWVYPSDGLDGSGNSRPLPQFEPRTLHPVASRYTD